MQNPRITAVALALGLSMFAAHRAGAAALVANYEFQDTLADSLSAGPTLANVGAGQNSFVSENVYGENRKVLAFPKDNGVLLSPTTQVIASDHYTIDMDFRIAATDGYRRLVDFKNSTSDCGLYAYIGTPYFFCYGIALSPLPVVHANLWTRVTVTRDTGGTVKVYLDGDEQISFDDNTGLAVIDAASSLYFFLDNQTGGHANEDSAGEVAAIRLYDDALAAADIAAAEPCGDANKSSEITTPDALVALKGAVGGHTCSLAICDVNADGQLTSTDALLILKESVGQNVVLHCVPESTTVRDSTTGSSGLSRNPPRVGES